MRSHHTLILYFVGWVWCIFCSPLWSVASLVLIICRGLILTVSELFVMFSIKAIACNPLDSFHCICICPCLFIRSLQRIYTWALGALCVALFSVMAPDSCCVNCTRLRSALFQFISVSVLHSLQQSMNFLLAKN